MCCTFFSTFGAVFLFAVSGLMRGGYKYLHIPGDNAILATPVAYAGFAYIAFTVASLCVWSRASAARSAALARLHAEAAGEAVEEEEDEGAVDIDALGRR